MCPPPLPRAAGSSADPSAPSLRSSRSLVPGPAEGVKPDQARGCGSRWSVGHSPLRLASEGGKIGGPDVRAFGPGHGGGVTRAHPAATLRGRWYAGTLRARSSAGERSPHTREAVGSNPAAPTLGSARHLPIELSRESQGSVACCLIRLVATERAVAPSAAETLMNRFSYCQPST